MTSDLWKKNEIEMNKLFGKSTSKPKSSALECSSRGKGAHLYTIPVNDGTRFDYCSTDRTYQFKNDTGRDVVINSLNVAFDKPDSQWKIFQYGFEADDNAVISGINISDQGNGRVEMNVGFDNPYTKLGNGKIVRLTFYLTNDAYQALNIKNVGIIFRSSFA